MRFRFGLAVLLLTTGLFAQEKNSLLWEITGNDLQEPSYVYGTMHVSRKIAFRLDDVFYDALYKSDIIALESDPGTWLRDRDKIKNTALGYGIGFITKGFYQYPFIINNPTKETLSSYLSFDDRLVNSILYRTNENSQNFEEDTYLDMFIYQAGKKFSKPVIALENLEESSALVGRANMNAMKPKPDEWLQKKMQAQDAMSLLENAYRERNINLIDSLDQAIYTEHYLNNMLYIRNRNMVVKLDSLIRTAKVFAGIGAAHLPGKNGVIQLLRKKGYTVNPLISNSTWKGNALKDTFENKISANKLKIQTPEDGLFSMLLPHELYPISEYTNTTYISPDLTNGSYVMINRIPTFSNLKKEEIYDLDKIDQLLFENIPGKILEKTRIKNGPYEGLDIRNQLKNGNYQRYHIYITPLEILIFKMGGQGEYVVQHSDTLFNSINFNQLNKNHSVFILKSQDFEVEMPATYHFSNQRRKGNRLIEGVDTLTSDYYFLKKATLHDFNYIEQDTFELKQIQSRFYEDLDISPQYGKFKDQSLVSFADFGLDGQKKLYLKTLIWQNDYYLLGTLSPDSTAADRYFNSLKIGERNYTNRFEKIRDTALFFTTISPVTPQKFVENSHNYYERGKKPKPYSAYTKQTIYQTNNNEAILVNVNKSHDFLMFPHIDSVWNLRKKLYRQKQFNIIREERPDHNDRYHELNLTLTDTASTRGILIKNIVKGGLLYELKTVIDTSRAPNRFVQEFFEHFAPTDTLIGPSLLEDKVPDFFKALREN
ncbi:MAG TPA: TraB/GumN family protein, partial [Arenibacter sp.]|nr:TraB/GumN family protein [Arenibacter sp.]